MSLHEVKIEDVKTDTKCIYCGKLILAQAVSIHGFCQEILVHRNCVVAFATRILNEFDKL